MTAITCFALWPDSYEQTIGHAILLGGDTDTIAAMAGAISAARLGARGLPKRWLDALEDEYQGRTYIERLARDLAVVCSE